MDEDERALAQAIRDRSKVIKKEVRAPASISVCLFSAFGGSPFSDMRPNTYGADRSHHFFFFLLVAASPGLCSGKSFSRTSLLYARILRAFYVSAMQTTLNLHVPGSLAFPARRCVRSMDHESAFLYLTQTPRMSFTRKSLTCLVI